MLAGARKNIESKAFPVSSAFAAAHDPPTAFEFVQSPAERLPFLKDESVDLLISGAPHDSKVFGKLRRIELLFLIHAMDILLVVVISTDGKSCKHGIVQI